MLFHRGQHTQITLHPSSIVIMDIDLNHLYKLPLAGKPSAVITLPLQDAPEALHRAVINAVCYAGHTLRHTCLYELVVEGTVGILKPSVAVEEGMRVRIGFYSLIKGLENQRIIVALTEHIGHDTPVAKVENGAQIEFVHLSSLIPLEFCYIGKPLLVWLLCIKLPVQKVLSKILWVLCMSGAATVVIFHGRADISGPADAEHPFVIDMDTVVMTQIVIEPPVALIRTFLVDLLDRIRKTFILCGPPTRLAGDPSVVG